MHHIPYGFEIACCTLYSVHAVHVVTQAGRVRCEEGLESAAYAELAARHDGDKIEGGATIIATASITSSKLTQG